MLCSSRFRKTMESRAAHAISMAVYHYHQAKYGDLTITDLDDKTAQVIYSMSITNIKYIHHWFKKPEIVIYSGHPGCVIGHRGELIEHLIKEVGHVLPQVNLRLVEAKLPYLFQYREETEAVKEMEQALYDAQNW